MASGQISIVMKIPLSVNIFPFYVSECVPLEHHIYNWLSLINPLCFAIDMEFIEVLKIYDL